MRIKICVGFGMYNPCDDCRHNIDNQPNFIGTANAPEGTYEDVNIDICKLGKPYYSQFEAVKSNS